MKTPNQEKTWALTDKSTGSNGNKRDIVLVPSSDFTSEQKARYQFFFKRCPKSDASVVLAAVEYTNEYVDNVVAGRNFIYYKSKILYFGLYTDGTHGMIDTTIENAVSLKPLSYGGEGAYVIFKVHN